jgi:NAD(P)-dependent dehydrogenase (short-subunit alcohol dehydrogenase family)
VFGEPIRMDEGKGHAQILREKGEDRSIVTKRTALVTGANRGLGREVVRQLATQGHRTILTARHAESAEHAAAEMRASGLDVLALTMDVVSLPSIEAARRTLAEWDLHIDMLVNNAAVLVGDHDHVLDTSVERYRETIETNVIGAIAVSQAFVPAMVDQRFGRVVNVSSAAGQLSTMSTYAPAYSLSKAALNAFTRQLAAATKRCGVLVNCACPGWVRTDMGGPSAPLSVEQGADTIVWLATLPIGGPTGGFFSKRRQIDW